MTPSNLSADSFRKWRVAQGLNHKMCAKRLGISVSNVYVYEAGKRKEGEVKIPLVVALAMSAIANNIKPWEGI